jgi:hypothetical protein
MVALVLSGGEAPISLTLVCVDEQTQPVEPSSAEILFIDWGETERVALPVDGNTVRLRLDPTWIRGVWPGAAGRNFHRALLLVKTPDFVAVRSEEVFLGTGPVELGGNGVGQPIEVRFPRQRGVALEAGDDRELEVTFRRPRARFLKIVDLEGRPVSGVEVTTSIAWTQSNHCAVPRAAAEFGSSVTDERGRVSIIDGDFEYGIALDKTHWSLPEADRGSTLGYLTMVLQEEETTIRMKEHEPARLEVLVTRGGVPAAGVDVMARLWPPRCGVFHGVLARTDESGRIVVDPFYPEEYSDVWITGPGGVEIWSVDPRALDYPADFEVELGKTERTSSAVRMPTG